MQTSTIRRRVWEHLTKFPKFYEIVSLVLLTLGHAVYFGMRASCCITLTFVVHEYSHIVSMKLAGDRILGVFYLPYLGGITFKQSNKQLSATKARTYLSGPLGGLCLGLVSLVWYLLSPNATALTILVATTVLNLFNMLPINPCDAGRVVRMTLVGLRFRTKIICWSIIHSLTLLFFVSLSIWWLGVLTVGVSAFFTWSDLRFEKKLNESPMTNKQRAITLVSHFIILGALTLLMVTIFIII